jgi:hypothetical protein
VSTSSSVVTGSFAASYAEARARFRERCASAGARVVEHPHPLPGPDGTALSLDEARFGPDDARRVLIVTSGTHGVEGYCGSGIQSFLLADGLASRLPDGVALVLVHAVNPWGFAWSRRVNEDNVDLNRNFLDHSAPHPVNPDYDALYDVLNLATLEPDAIAAGLARLKAFESERGWEAMYRALSGGQYEHPRGVQYGGVEETWSNRTLRALWARHAARAEVAALVDLHSGLGPRAVGMLLQTAPESSVAARLGRHCWTDVLRSEPAAGTDAALVSGLMGPAFVAALPNVAAVGLVLEFGTRELTEVMLAVQADHWLDAHGDRASEEGRAISRRMRDAFFLEDEDWQIAVCERARDVVDQALRGVATYTPEERP